MFARKKRSETTQATLARQCRLAISSISHCLNHSILRPLVQTCNSLLRDGAKELLVFAPSLLMTAAFLAMSLVAAMPAYADGTTIDLWQSFPDNQGDNGFFAYGYAPATNTYWLLSDCGSNHFCRPEEPNWGNPHVFRSDTVNGWLGEPWIGLFPSGTVSNTGSPEDAVLAWVVPNTAYYQVNGSFYVSPQSANGADLYIKQNTKILFSYHLPPGGTQDFDVASSLFNAGDKLHFEVDAHNDVYFSEYNDWPFIKGQIRMVPVPGTGQLPDLAISAKDIHATTNADGTVTLTADVHNQGTSSASNVQVQFYDFNQPLGDPVPIAQVSPNGIGSASAPVSMAASGDHLVRVVIDPAGMIEELAKTNNEASQIIQPGGPDPTAGNILVTGNLPSTVYAGCLSAVTGHAVYAINVNGTTNTDYVVKGGAVQIAVEGDGNYGDIHTDIYGNFSKSLQAPASPGTYRISMTVTDQTFSGTRDSVFSVIPAPAPGCPPPPPPPPPTSSGTGYWTFDPAGGPSGTWSWVWTTPPTEPIPESDLRVFSEDIHFSKNNPAANEEITIFAEIHYWASSTALVAQNVPVNLYVTDPASQSKMKIGQTVINSLSVGSPDFGSRYVSATWKNQAQGIYIVEVEIDPSYVEAYRLNNAATRAIIVGQVPDSLGVISGQVTTPLGGVGNVTIHVFDANGEIGNAVTGPTGSYLVKDVPLGTLQVHIDTPNGYLADAATKTVTVSNQVVSTVDFHLKQSVPVKTGALTIGFWQNKNGQAIITGGASTSGVCNSGTWLRQYVPYQDLSATATCSQMAMYATNIVKAATASGSSMNAMLKAQMLATSLDVYFSDPALGGNKIAAPVPIGGIAIDLTKVCTMIDSSSGTATCSGVYQNANSAFGGAASLTVSQMLVYAASQSNAGGSLWYGQVKATQELAKNAFDAINNRVAFAP